MLHTDKKFLIAFIASALSATTPIAIASDSHSTSYDAIAAEAAIIGKPSYFSMAEDDSYCSSENSFSPWFVDQNTTLASKESHDSDASFLDSYELTSIDISELDEIRGTFTEITAETLGLAMLEANLLNNSANNAATGNNVVTDGAFGNSQGVVSLIQNSGNNVVIQSATVVNLTLSE